MKTSVLISAAAAAAMAFALGQLPAGAQAPALPAPHFHHIHLNSTNPDAAIAFYMKQFANITKTSWNGIAALMPSLEKGIATYGPMLSKGIVLAFQYHAAIFYFLGEEYPACRKWLHQITEESRTEHRMDIQHLARVMGLLLIWKKGEYDLLEYQHRSVQRYFESKGGGEVEQRVLDMVHKLLNDHEPASQIKALEDFKTQISHPEIIELLGATTLRAWALAQIAGKSPREFLGAS